MDKLTRDQIEFYAQGLNDAFAAQRWTDVQNIADHLRTRPLGYADPDLVALANEFCDKMREAAAEPERRIR